MEQTSTRTRINKKKFAEVRRDIRAQLAAGTYRADVIASRHHISNSSVQGIRRREVSQQ